MISDTRVASERTLLERSNRIHYGNLLTLPIAGGGFLYVEPLFTERLSTQADGSTFPPTLPCPRQLPRARNRRRQSRIRPPPSQKLSTKSSGPAPEQSPQPPAETPPHHPPVDPSAASPPPLRYHRRSRAWIRSHHRSDRTQPRPRRPAHRTTKRLRHLRGGRPRPTATSHRRIPPSKRTLNAHPPTRVRRQSHTTTRNSRRNSRRQN